MSALFEQLAAHETPMGVISLRRRQEPSRKVDVYEVKLGDAFLMSSLFTVAEIELARLGLVEVDGDDLDVVVGGLGLGYTAVTVLEDPRVARLTVVEALGEVIDWHERRLLPEVTTLVDDPRTRLVHGDFFDLVRDEVTGAWDTDRRHHAILVDIDHSPRHVLDPRHAAFYTTDGLRRLTRHLHQGGVFGLWSDDPPDDGFLEVLGQVFTHARAQVVAFPNFLTGGESANTVYLAS